MTGEHDSDRIEALFADDEAIDAALREAVQDALRQHKIANNPVSGWRNGNVAWILPEDIQV